MMHGSRGKKHYDAASLADVSKLHTDEAEDASRMECMLGAFIAIYQ